MKSEGIDVCGFGAGEPDFDTPEHIKAAAIAALEGRLHEIHAQLRALPELRQAIAEKFAADNGLEYRAEPDHREQRRQAFLLQRHPRHLPARATK